MASRGYQKRGYHGARRQHSNPHPRYQPLPPIPLPPRPGQSELSSPFHSSTHGGDYSQFQYQEQTQGNGRYGFSSSSYLHRGRGKGSYQKSYSENTNIAEYYNQSMLEDPWGQLIEEFNQSDFVESECEPTKPTDIEFGTMRDKSFSRIQNRNQEMAETPLSEYGTDFIGPQFDTSPLGLTIEEEPYIPSMPREDQQPEISLADDLISPFGAQESKCISSLSTNEITAVESENSCEPYVPSGYSENNSILEPYSPLKSGLVPDSYQPYSPKKPAVNIEN